MASRIYEYSKSVARFDFTIEKTTRTEQGIKEYANRRMYPIIAKGNIYQGITAQW